MTPTIDPLPPPRSDPSDSALERRLDQLVPPPRGPALKLAIGGGLLIATIGLVILTIGGFLFPSPFNDRDSAHGSSALLLDRDRGLVGATVLVPNFSSRELRLTGITLDAPGAVLVDVEARRQGARSNDAAQPLPVGIGSHEVLDLVVWFEVTGCQVEQPGPWGVVDATFDFGEGSFPFFSRTLTLQDTISEPGEGVTLLDGDRAVNGADPLAVACGALR